MLILCNGPDTFRAQQHAEKLERAYCDKFGVDKTHIEYISSGRAGLEELQEKAQTISLFEPKRFFKIRNLLKDSTKKELPILQNVLSQNSEDLIVVSIEDNAPKAEVIRALSDGGVKIIKYSYLFLRGRDFLEWVVQEARVLSVRNQEAVEAIAVRCESDTWYAYNELMKLRVSGNIFHARKNISNVFQDIERVLVQNKACYNFLLSETRSKEVCAMFPSQLKTAVQIRDECVDGVHPYTRKKMIRLNLAHAHLSFLYAEEMLLLSRFGFIKEGEGGVLL